MTLIVCHCSNAESLIIEYQTQQYKLFPMLATAYAYWFAGQKLQKAYYAFQNELKHGNAASLPEVSLLKVCLCRFWINNTVTMAETTQTFICSVLSGILLVR